MKEMNLLPNPTSLIESMRNMGYSLETAIADIIDNSITAESKNINIRFDWNRGAPWLAIIDDGIGMDEKVLISAMRLGSQNPLEERKKNDLGRFGLGLKTASFSQCRHLTVLSKNKNGTNCAKWDLDSLSSNTNSQWILCLLDKNEIYKHPVLSKLENNYLDSNFSGTIVLWENIDRINEGTSKNDEEKHFNESIANVRSHLELVFHRFLSPSLGESKINIFINNARINGFDPFNTKKSTELRREVFRFKGENIIIQPYILPHHNKISKSEWQKYAGKQGYLHEQGFYVYRNRRLIISANWFRLIRKEELTKLLRVKVDIPNTLDHLWKIDIKKSNAVPPLQIKNELKRIIGKIEFSGKKVYKQKGQKIIDKVTHPTWSRVAKNNQIFYQINREHPIIKQYIENIPNSDINNFNNILSMIESTFPRECFRFQGYPENYILSNLVNSKLYIQAA